MPEPVAPGPPSTPSVSSPPPRRYPARERHPPQEWWKLPSTSHKPVVESSDEEPSSNDSAEESCMQRQNGVHTWKSLRHLSVCLRLELIAMIQRPLLKPWHILMETSGIKQHMRRFKHF